MRVINNKIDKERMLEIFKEAFSKSPGMVWMTNGNVKKLKTVLSFFIEEASMKNGAYLTSDGNGAVLYFQLHNAKTSIKLTLRKLYLILFVLGLKKGIQIIRMKKIIDSIRPTKGYFGWLFATDPKGEGSKAAYEVKKEMFRIADESMEPIFVETTRKRARLLYLKSGYVEYQTIKHPFKDLLIYFLKREPKLEY